MTPMQQKRRVFDDLVLDAALKLNGKKAHRRALEVIRQRDRKIEKRKGARNVTPMQPPKNPPYDCTDENEHNCPNMEEDPDDRSMERERYRCLVCGRSYKLWYEDMK